jgi:hypothetical protein
MHKPTNTNTTIKQDFKPFFMMSALPINVEW